MKIALLPLCYMPSYAEEAFKGETFLEWREEAQHSYIQISIVMASVIASQMREGFAGCIGEWYSPDPGTEAERNREIVAVIRENPEFHPSGVILAVVQKQCGEFAKGS